VKNEKGVVFGYSLLTPAHNQMFQSMISRGYITSLISLPEKFYVQKNAVEEDGYILLLRLILYQKHGLGKKMIFAISLIVPL
jgi:hypothetical protein